MTQPIKEHEIGQGTSIVYSPLTSCLTATCVLSEGKLVGAHFVQDKAQNTEELKTLLKSLKDHIGHPKQHITAIYIIGPLDFWGPSGLMIPFQTELAKALQTSKIYHNPTANTSGEGETISVMIKDQTQITVEVTYPPNAKDKKWAGKHDLLRDVVSGYFTPSPSPSPKHS